MMDGWLDGAQSELGGSPPMTKKEPKGQMIQRDSSSLLTFDVASALLPDDATLSTVEAEIDRADRFKNLILCMPSMVGITSPSLVSPCFICTVKVRELKNSQKVGYFLKCV